MFNPTQADVRRFFCATHAKQQARQPMEAIETLAGLWIAEHPEYQPELADVDTALARNYDARIIAITLADSPLAELADVLLPLQPAETSFIYKPTAARYGMLLAIDLLATELALALPDDNQERLRRIKLALDDYRGGPDSLPLGD